MPKLPSTISYNEDGDCMQLTIIRMNPGNTSAEIVTTFTVIGIAKGPDGFIVKVGDKELAPNEEHELN